ncbi:type I polyketide synthase [Couchioplanes caeruleus]|uniref:type I polyketide synthase n=1 Tax=Couchioplanes caeruleus TaxID=56438 RepID=UPI0020C06DD7|nr:type I polyketide synthase [Couchioplanes caeruleus]UQU67678.1 type I polyketide synthase [Couchioplanes caeruleus]
MSGAEPIAIIGMSCRFAGGVDSPEKFWTLLTEGADVVSEVPDSRWEWYASRGRENAAALRDVTRGGAFLSDVEGFDADFFDITPREAALMDPQQRMMLELSWEALERAGIPPARLGGTDAGVFMGVGADDYGRRMLEDLPGIEAWTGIGGAYCAVANRVSYLLNLRGPSMAVDTACSSSLVAIHLAVQALRAGECPVALAGGVLVMAAPGLSLVLDAAGATSPDGRCKSFDASADGYGRGEGGGVVVLKRLSDARRDGDPVLAVLRGSAVHQDGRTNGIMAPNGEAQAHVMRQAYRAAGIDPASVQYVEAHGTGTRVGDPLEAGAMAAVFGQGRPADQPCLIGSVKPNVGHLEAGAGVAGVIKTVLALQHGVIPPSINCSTPNPAIPWEQARLRVVTEPTPWPGEPGRRRAGVSAYGYGGTIAHVALEAGDPPAGRDRRTAPERPVLVPISGRSAEAVRRFAGALADHLTAEPGLDPRDVAYTLAHRRDQLPHRATVVGADRAEVVDQLREFAVEGTGAQTGSVLGAAARGVVWVFSGHGSQWLGMARGMLADEPVFAGVIDRVEPVFVTEMGVSPRRVIVEAAPQPVDVIQPMIFAIQVALAAVWRSRGVRPAAVIGHSVGEIAAAVTAGVLTLEEGARLVCRRSVLLRQVAGKGAMAMVGLPADEIERRLAGRSDVAAAVAAAPGSTVISGDIAAVEELGARWRAEGYAVRPVDSDVAFHSPQMEPLCGPLAAAVDDLSPRPAEVPLYSTALPDPRSGAPRDGSYWAANLRGQVRFAPAVTAAAEDGYRLFLEVSPHPVVEHSIGETLEQLGIEDAFATHTLRRNRPEIPTLLGNLGLLYCHGLEADTAVLWGDGAFADLPTTVWQRRPYWLESRPVPAATEPHDPRSHTLLGGRRRVNGVTPAEIWSTYLDRDCRPYPGAHPVRNVEIIPAAVLLNTFFTAAASTGPWPDLGDVGLRVPVSVTHPRDVQVVLQDGALRLSSRVVEEEADDSGWATHTTAVLEPRTRLADESPATVVTGESLDTGYVIDRLATLGVAAMGFPWAVERMERGDGALRATVVAEPETGATPQTWGSILDAALSIASVVFTGPPILRMPQHIRRVSLAESAPARARILVRVVDTDTVDLEICDLDGAVVGRMSRLRYGVLDRDTGGNTDTRSLVHTLAWQPVDLPGQVAAPRLVVVGAASEMVSRLQEWLPEHIARVVERPEDLRPDELSAGHHLVVVAPPVSGGYDDAAVEGAWLLARTAQLVAAGRAAKPAQLWCLTRGVWESTDAASVSQGALWGLGRVIGGEHPDFWGGVIDVGGPPSDIAVIPQVIGALRGEDVIVVRDGAPMVGRLRHLEGKPMRPPMRCEPDGTYLITGGFGALGSEVAHWLADRGARRIILVGRTTVPERDGWSRVTDPRVLERIEIVRSLERLGVTVVPVALDLADAEEAAKLLSAASYGLPPVRGVVHAAGVLDNRMLSALDEDSLRAVLRPKAYGATTLHELFPPGSVDFFVLFSSCGLLLGLPGQASYAAGNAYLDALAAYRRAAGDTGTISFGWTSWRGLGMSTSTEVIDIELAARGTADISAAEAFSAWELAERYDLGYAAVLRMLPAAERGELRLPLLSELPLDSATDESAEVSGERPWATLHGAELVAFLTGEIRRQVAVESKLSADEVDPRRPLIEMGLDSVMTVRIRRALERTFHLPLPATLFWDRPTISAVAALVAERLDDDPAPAAEEE